MKKVILSTIVVLSFVIYSVYAHTKGISERSIIVQKQTRNTSKPTNTPFQTPSTTTQVPPSPTQTNTPSETPTGTITSTPSPTPTQSSPYKDGSYTGSIEDAIYGNIQVRAIIKQGKITNVNFLQAPNDRSTSIDINSQADPMLAQEAIQAQAANVDIISGATDSSQAFIQSLQSALNQAQK